MSTATVAPLVALRINDAHGIAINALMAAGLVLFAMTLFVNVLATEVVRRTTPRGAEA